MVGPRSVRTPSVCFLLMRSFLAVALLVASLAALPVQAQDPAAPLLTDPAGDVMLSVSGQDAGSASTLYPEVDLVSLSLAETSDAFTWTLGLADVRNANEETGADGAWSIVSFAHNGRFFELYIGRSFPALNGLQTYVELSAAESPAGPFSGLWISEATVDLAANTFSASVPRDLLADPDGAAPFPGRVLEAIAVRSTSVLSGITLIGGVPQTSTLHDITDAMPDTGGVPATYAVQVGVQQSGHARLASATPFRASNGEATTFVYEVDAANLGEDNASFELTASGAPARVDVVIPVPLLAIPAGQSIRVPVLATIPFGHQHGGIDRFLLELTDVADSGSVGRLEMGIRYLAVPQPAGHHDTLWLHMPPDGASNGAVLPFVEAFMNTLDADERAGTGNYYSTGFSGSGTTTWQSWTFGLSPGLEMGLDLDPTRTGEVSITVGSMLPLVGATLSGYLYVGTTDFFDDDTYLAYFESEAVDIDPNGRHTFDVELQPFDDVDPLPYEAGRNLYLDVELEYTGVPPPALGQAEDSPYLASGGYMRLPLNEWHDDVDDALNAVGGPVLKSKGPQERLVNPGEAAVFQAFMTNPTDEDIPVGFEVTGKHSDWATLPQTKYVLPAKGNVTVSLIVRPPVDALDEERADLILQVYPEELPELRALLRLVAEVDTDSDLADEAPLASELTKKESPLSPLTSGLALLAALGLARRRR